MIYKTSKEHEAGLFCLELNSEFIKRMPILLKCLLQRSYPEERKKKETLHYALVTFSILWNCFVFIRANMCNIPNVTYLLD